MAKITISMPDELLGTIDELAGELAESRSGLIQEASARYVTQVLEERARVERRERIDRAIRSAREIGSRLEPFDSTAAIRADRDRDGRRAGER
jgi:predicted transcriptional regulator